MDDGRRQRHGGCRGERERGTKEETENLIHGKEYGYVGEESARIS